MIHVHGITTVEFENMMTTNYSYGGEMPDWLVARAALSPDKQALAVGDERLTFPELDGRATAVARRLAMLGVAAGDRVAALLRNGVPMVELAHGVGRAGAVLVPLNLRLAPAELSWQIEDSGAKVLIHDGSVPLTPLPPLPQGERGRSSQQSWCPFGATRQESSPLPRAGEPAGPSGPQTRGTSPKRSAGPEVRVLHIDDFYAQLQAGLPPRERIDLAAVHTIIYTSGTTGRPKGAMLTYGNHWWGAIGSALNLGLREDDRWLAPLPLFHVGGLSILMRGVIYGIPALVHERFDPARINQAIDEDGVTIVSVVATMLRRMLDERGDRPYPPTFRCALLGGGPAPLPLLEECVRRGVPVVQTYGMTETASQAVTLAPQDALRKPGSAGKPLLPMELRIERDGTAVPPGEPGEIILRGPGVTPGYADRPEETALALRDGWLHTGDLGYLDVEGYLYVLDRRSDLIISGGENVYPAEIESVLLAHPGVAEAGVTGEEDPQWGQVPVAYVVARPGHAVTAEELIAFAQERLARYKVPARIYVTETLPRNAAGKLLRRELGAARAKG